MATRIILTSIDDSKELECYAVNDTTIELSVKCIGDNIGFFIPIDRQTAIKLSKVLKTEISKLPY